MFVRINGGLITIVKGILSLSCTEAILGGYIEVVSLSGSRVLRLELKLL